MSSGTFWLFLRKSKKGIKEAVKLYPDDIVSIGIDTWGVDYGLLDKNGDLIGNPYMYRDSRTDSAVEEVFKIIPKNEDLYEPDRESSLQSVQHDLSALGHEAGCSRTSRLRHEYYLSIPDLLNYWLTGNMMNEYSHASTTTAIVESL